MKLHQGRARELVQANGILGSIRRWGGSRDREGIVSLCSAFMRPHMQYCIQVWGLQYKKDRELLERVQRRATKMLRGLQHLPLQRQAERAGLFQPGEEKTAG